MPHEVSPSQIETARRCFRRWAWQSVHGFKPPTAASAQFGSDVHAALEHRIGTGAWPMALAENVRERAEVALAALLEVYPDATPGAFIERDWRMDDGLPLPARGRADLVLPQANAIVDWKTTSDFRYVKSDKERETDAQTVLYAQAFVREGLLRLPLDFAHVWTVTKGPPQAKVTITRVTAEMLSIGMAKCESMVKAMRRYVDERTENPLDFPGNPLACRDFNTVCHHFDRCFPKTETEVQEMNGNAKALIAARKAELGQVHAPAVNPPDVSPTVVDSVFASAAFESAPPSPEPEKRKRGRPRKTTGVDTPQTGADKPQASVDKSLVGKLEVELPVTTAPVHVPLKAHAGHTLLIGAVPLKSNAPWTLGTDWLAPFVQQACENLRVPFYGLADYGKGKQAVAALVADAVKRGALPMNLVLDRRDPIADAVAEILIPEYQTVLVKLG